MKRLSWHNYTVFRCKNQIIVAVTKIFESGPIKSRVRVCQVEKTE